MSDPLFDVKNAFHLGNYQQCIKEATKAALPADAAVDAKCYLYRAYIAQKKFRTPLDEIGAGADDRLKAVRLYAEYMASEKKR